MGPGLVESVWRYRWMVLLLCVLGGVLGYTYSSLQPVVYRATAPIILGDPVTSVLGSASAAGSQRHLVNEASFIDSTSVAERASDLLGGVVSPQEIDEDVRGDPAPEGDVILLTAVASDPASAAAKANAVGEAYQQLRLEELRDRADAAIAELDEAANRLREELSELEASLAVDPDNSALMAQQDAAASQLATLEARANQIAVDSALIGSGVSFFEPARPPSNPFQPRPLRTVAMGLVLGGVAGAGLAWWRAGRSQVVEGRHDPASILQAPLLGEVPEFRRLGLRSPIPSLSAPGSIADEAFQFIASAVGLALETTPAVLVVTSPSAGDGKTVTAINLAIAAARDGRKVILVDADERMRGLSRFGGTAPEPGLTDLVRSDVSVSDCIRHWQVSDSISMPVVPAGSKPDDTAGFFRSNGFRKTMDRLREQADLVVVDTPPIMAVADTSTIATRADGIMMVVRHGTPLRALEEVRLRLDFLGTPLIGYVHNRSEHWGDRSFGRYSYGYLRQTSRPGRLVWLQERIATIVGRR